MLASIINDRTERRVQIHMPGGQINACWREDGEVMMTGRADIVYSGEWLAGL
jgi:diaminopimelate epimerase